MADQKRDGRNTEREIAGEYERRMGHPMPDRNENDEGGSIAVPGDPGPNMAPRSNQHARQGQAESPRELTLNQPEKKKEGHR
jgi:hypothetical protein